MTVDEIREKDGLLREFILAYHNTQSCHYCIFYDGEDASLIKNRCRVSRTWYNGNKTIYEVETEEEAERIYEMDFGFVNEILEKTNFEIDMVE